MVGLTVGLVNKQNHGYSFLLTAEAILDGIYTALHFPTTNSREKKVRK